MSFNMRTFLFRLQKLSEASSHPRYAYSYVDKNSQPTKHFADNCKHFAGVIEKSTKGATLYQTSVLKSIARHVGNQNLSLAQDAIDKLDFGTRRLIPESALNFISRNS